LAIKGPSSGAKGAVLAVFCLDRDNCARVTRKMFSKLFFLVEREPRTVTGTVAGPCLRAVVFSLGGSPQTAERWARARRCLPAVVFSLGGSPRSARRPHARSDRAATRARG